MYHTMRKIVETVKAKYQGIEELSKGTNPITGFVGCQYSHGANGVGCAIGCLLSSEDADYLDMHGPSQIDDIVRIDGANKQIIRKYINLKRVSGNSLFALQNAHDNAENVSEFITTLDRYLETGKWK